PGEEHRLDGPSVDSVASVLGVLRRCLFYRGCAQPDHQNSDASVGEFARLYVLPLRSADGRPRLGTRSARSVRDNARAAATILQRRLSGAGSQIYLAR